MEYEVLIGGSGGQGVMLLGSTLATAAIKDNKNSSCLPSYGPEMRGGTANCTVVISPEAIVSPIPYQIRSAIILNEPSYQKFRNFVVKDGLLITNSSLISNNEKRENVEELGVPCNEIAQNLGDVRVANMVALGAYIKKTGLLSEKSIYSVLEEKFGGKEKVILLNKQAVLAGMDFVE